MSRVVLVTGSSTGGIGYALCEEFAKKGCKVYATARNISKIADFPESLPVQVEKLELDVNNDESIAKALAYVEEKEGRLDVLVNNAGVTAPGPLIEVPIELVKDVYETNVFAILRLCRAAVPLMNKHNSGNIINIGSIVGEMYVSSPTSPFTRIYSPHLTPSHPPPSPVPWSGVYASSKAAVYMLSEILSMELSPFNITVTHIAPGAIKSNIAANCASRITLSPTSLYERYAPFIQKRVDSSQGPNAMDTREFARRVVGNAMRRRPGRYLTLGGSARMFSVLKWLPRGFVLWMMWRMFSPRK
ncbi:hypothetical protein CVT26_002317 [Gymnopilus dilepis]|uniref:Uncharacterized protein n=1 Tax=Gymnopilus dilepis TaxID=231916 RepID=A0A409Y3L6_9AGAR|nr:hypothetical protein CVT26_002317 [Gymnopilus dilepis]